MTTSSFSARIPEDLHQAIKEDCQRRGISQADFLVELAMAHLNAGSTGKTVGQRLLALEHQVNELMSCQSS